MLEAGARLAARLAVLAGGLGCSPDTSAWSARMAPEAEAARVLWRFNDTGAAWPAEACVHELVGAQAARTPAGVALEWHGATLTYAALQGCARAVGAWLAAHGACADRVVARQALKRSARSPRALFPSWSSMAMHSSASRRRTSARQYTQ